MRNPISRRQVIVGGAAGLAALATGVACGRPLFLPSGNKFDSAAARYQSLASPAVQRMYMRTPLISHECWMS